VLTTNVGVMNRIPAGAERAEDGDMKKLLYKIAKAYYEDHLTQREISERLGLSRVKVSRLLGRARDEGVVQIQVVSPEAGDADLERELETQWGLKEVVVVPEAAEGDVQLRHLGLGAASYLKRILQSREIIALAWGNSISALVDQFTPFPLPEIRVVQMVGGLGDPESDSHGSDLARRLANALQARPRLLPAPGVVRSRQIRDSLFHDPQIAGTLQMANSADLAVVGIGTLNEGAVLRAGTILSSADVTRLKRKRVVGNICLHFFDADGQSVSDEIDERMIGLTLSEIRRLPRVIAIASGPAKFAAIRAALTGRFVTVLITDRGTALRLRSDRA